MTKDHEEGQNSSEAEINTAQQPQQQLQPQPQHQEQERQGDTAKKEAENPLNEQGANTNMSSTSENNNNQSDESVVDLHCHEENLASWVENIDETTRTTETTIVDRIEFLIRRRKKCDPKPLSYYQQLLAEQEHEPNEEGQLEQQKQVNGVEHNDANDEKKVPSTTTTTSPIIEVDDEEDGGDQKEDDGDEEQQMKNTMSLSDLLCTEEGLESESSSNDLPDANIIHDFQKKREREKSWSKRYETLIIPKGQPIVWPIEPELLDGEKFESIFQGIVEDEMNQQDKIKEMEQKRNKLRRLQLSDEDREFLNTNALLLRYSWDSLNINSNNPNIGANAYNAILQNEQTSCTQSNDEGETTTDTTNPSPQVSRSQVHHIIQTLPRPKTIPHPPVIGNFLDDYANSTDVMDYETYFASSSKKETKLCSNNGGSNNDDISNNKNQTTQDAAAAAADTAIDADEGVRGEENDNDPFQTIGQLYVEFCRQDYTNSEESFKKSTNHWSSEGLQEYIQNLNQQCNELEVQERQVLKKATEAGIANAKTWSKAYSHLGVVPRTLETEEITSYSAPAPASVAGRPKMG